MAARKPPRAPCSSFGHFGKIPFHRQLPDLGVELRHLALPPFLYAMPDFSAADPVWMARRLFGDRRVYPHHPKCELRLHAKHRTFCLVFFTISI
jgi:hypothetical protein